MDLSSISLLFLLGCIVLGFVMKRNIGLIAIALALILGRLGHIEDSVIISGFNSNLFLILLGVSYLFTIAENNKTLELLARKTIALAGNRINLIPLVLVALGTIIAMTGPGTIPALALCTMLSTTLAKELDIDPLPFTVCSFMGAAAGGMSPIAPTGIIALEIAAKQGYSGFGIPYMLTMMAAAFIFGAVYYFATGVFKLKAATLPAVMRQVEPLNRNQWITIAGIVVMMVLVIFFKFNVGLTSFLVAGILNLIGVCDERKIFANISWSTLIMVCGVGVLMNVIIELGGIAQLSAALASLMNTYTAPPLMCLGSGIMGWFASTSGVVIPTLIPTVPGIIAHLADVTPLSLISALSIGSQMAGISPGSTGGALALAAYVTLFKPSAEEKNRYFIRLFVTSIFAVLFVTALGFANFYNWIQ
jgi:di/tricarboxylate transporter